MSILQSKIYRLLKPRLQKIIQDVIFSEFNYTFAHVLEDCHPGFCRLLFSYSKLEAMMGTHREDVAACDCKGIELIKINQISSRVIFILSGEVFVTDRSKKYVYATLGPGSCFGDMSLLLN